MKKRAVAQNGRQLSLLDLFERFQIGQRNLIVGAVLLVFWMRFQADDGDILLLWTIYPIHAHGTAASILQVGLPNLSSVSPAQVRDFVRVETGIKRIAGKEL